MWCCIICSGRKIDLLHVEQNGHFIFTCSRFSVILIHRVYILNTAINEQTPGISFNHLQKDSSVGFVPGTDSMLLSAIFSFLYVLRCIHLC